MDTLELHDEHFHKGKGVYQVKGYYGDDLRIRALIANTDTIDKSLSDGKLLLKLPNLNGAGGERRVAVENVSDTNDALRVVGATPSQGIGHGMLRKSIETQYRGDCMTFVSNTHRTWDLESAFNAYDPSSSFSGSLQNLSIASVEVSADGERVYWGVLGEAEVNADKPLGFLSRGGEQLTTVAKDADGNVLNGVPVFYQHDDEDIAATGLSTSSAGLLTATEMGTAGDRQPVKVLTPDTTDYTNQSFGVVSMAGLSPALQAVMRAVHAGLKVEFYSAAAAGGTKLGETAVLPGATYDPNNDNTVHALIYRQGLVATEEDGDASQFHAQASLDNAFNGTVKSIKGIDSAGGEWVKNVSDRVTTDTDTIIARMSWIDEGDGPVAHAAMTEIV